jgi:uncharacterized membrane protein
MLTLQFKRFCAWAGFLLLLCTGCPGFGSQGLHEHSTVVPENPNFNEHISVIMENHCLSCHDDPPAFNAPGNIWLGAYSNEEPLGTFESREDVVGRSLDRSNPMPPANFQQLDRVERETLQLWLDNNAPEGPPAEEAE